MAIPHYTVHDGEVRADRNEAPPGRCPWCDYPLQPGRCSECGQLLGADDLVYTESARRLMGWERRSALGKVCTLPLVAPSMLAGLFWPARLPRSPVVSRYAVALMLLLALLAGAMLCIVSYWELLQLDWLFMILAEGARPFPPVLLVLSAPGLVGALRARSQRAHLWWRATVYGLCWFVIVHALWMVWTTFGPLSMNHPAKPHGGGPDEVTGIWGNVLALGTLAALLLYPAGFLLVLPWRAVGRAGGRQILDNGAQP